MNGVRCYSKNLYRESLKRTSQSNWTPREIVRPSSQPSMTSARLTEDPKKQEDDINWPRRFFSGIQPTGSLHLGNYLGTIQKWASLQDSKENVTCCIVDMHSITVPQDPTTLRARTLEVAATLLACGIDPAKANVFVQSAVAEHAELCWILGCLCTTARLSHLPQYKEKSVRLQEVPMGLFAYPVLQAADIMLYKATHVPVGEDQVQHIQLAQHLANSFNKKYAPIFPICHAVIDNKSAARIRSLRQPNKKMSKSDTEQRGTIYLTDEPHVIREKIKKAVTDFTSDVSYDPENRVGVSNLITLHSLITGQSVEKICNEAASLDTGKYKLRVADAVIEHLNPIRSKIKQNLAKSQDLCYFLEMGAEKARQIAQQTMWEVKEKMGLGAQNFMPKAESKYATAMPDIISRLSTSLNAEERALKITASQPEDTNEVIALKEPIDATEENVVKGEANVAKEEVNV